MYSDRQMVFCDRTVLDFNRGRLYQRTKLFYRQSKWSAQGRSNTQIAILGSYKLRVFKISLPAGTQEQWVSEWIDLSEYLGKHVFLELYFNSTFSGVPHDGFYIDDIKIYAESPTGTQEPIADKIRLEPNPANDVLHIRIEDFKISQIQEYNFQLSSPDGKKWVAPLRTADGGWDLEVSHLPKGLYILHTGRNMSQSHSLHFIVN